MKRRILIVMFLGVVLMVPSMAQSQADKVLEQIFGPRVQSRDLRVLQLEMNPDPVREGQWVSFQTVISNLSKHSGRVNLFIKDRDEVVASVYDIALRPGDNRIAFPQTNYRFSRNEYCFTIEVDIEKTKRALDVAKEFCAKRTRHGYTFDTSGAGSLFVEDLDMVPDPVSPGQEVVFKARLRNDGSPLRVTIRIQDRDQIVAQVDDIYLPRGRSDLLFPSTRYQFQRFDHCFTVLVDIGRTPYRVDAAREFCAKPYGWSLRP